MSYRTDSYDPDYNEDISTWSLDAAVSPEDDGSQLLRLALCLFIIPTVGLLVSAGFALGDEGAMVTRLALLGYALGALIFVLVIGTPKLAGTDRARMSLMFGPSVRLVMLLLAVSVLVQAALFIYSLFTLEASTIGRVHGGLMVVVGLGALYVCLALIKSAFGMFSVEPMHVRASRIPNLSPIRERMDTLATRLNAKCPDHIVVGLEPNFFVTSAPVKLVGSNEHLTGTTLFVSLSLMRLFSDAEFDAVIGHELGHFRGEDTVYSLKFAPTYARLSQALLVLANGSGNASDLGRIPALAALAAYLSRFTASERTVGRERELLADQAGASASSKEALATALLKVALFSGNWNWLTQQHVAELNEGRTFTTLSTTFNQVSRLADDVNWEEIRNSVSSSIQAHPIDTHPTFAERLQALGLASADLNAADCEASPAAAVALLENAEELDEDLSELEANWLLAIGAAQLPNQATGLE